MTNNVRLTGSPLPGLEAHCTAYAARWTGGWG